MSRFTDQLTGATFSVADEHDDLFATAQYKKTRGGRRAASGDESSHPVTGSTPTQRAQN